MTPVQHKDDCRAMKTRRPWECDCMPAIAAPEPMAEVHKLIGSLLDPVPGYEMGYNAGLWDGRKAPNYPAAAAVAITLAIILVALC